MSAIALEAAVRSAILIMLVWATAALVRPRNPHLLKAMWTTVVVASLGMPLVMQIHVAPAVAAPLLEWTLRPAGLAPTHAASLRAWGIFAYLAPAALLLWRHLSAWRRLWRIRRESRVLAAPWADGLDVRVSPRISSPATFGTTVLLPEECSSWKSPKLAAVMAHERAHVLHRDCYVLWLARLHACIFWFNPLAWWVVRRLAVLAEQTSDEAAVERLGSGVDYAEILLGLGMGGASGLAAPMAASDLPARIDRILAGIKLSPALRRRQLVLVVAAVLPAVALAAAPLQLARAQSAQSATGAANSLEPRVVSWGPLADYYPEQALHQDIEGLVELAITLDRAGRPTDTQILTEDPLDMGFGAAASAAAHAMQYTNPTGRPVTFTVRFAFKLANAPAVGSGDSAAPSTSH